MNKLPKYIVVFDLETTGLDKSKDFIIQFGAIKIDTETGKIIDKIDQLIKPEGSYSINIAAYFKHGIKPEMLEDKPTLKEFAPKIINFFGNKSVGVLTYNGKRFDQPFLKNRLNAVGFDIDFTQRKTYDAFKIEQSRRGNKLTQVFERMYGKTMDEMGLIAHNALSDVKATWGVFKKQIEEDMPECEEMYGEDGVIEMMEFQGQNKPCFTLGKYRQLSVEFVSTIDQNYLQWCISDKCSFVNSTKEYIKQFIK